MNLILKNLLENAEKRQDNNSSPPLMKICAEKQDRPLPDDLLEQQNIPYGDPANALSANVVYPRNGDKDKLPVIVFVHGGALVTGDRNSDRVFCQEVARQGFVVYSIEYRLIDRADAFGMVSDLCSALAMVKETLPSFGGNPDRVSLCAESAGAFLSLYATAAGKSEKLRGMLGCGTYDLPIYSLILISGMIYTTGFGRIGVVYRKQLYKKKRKDRKFMAAISPNNSKLISALPPIYLISSRADFLRKETRKYNRALNRNHHAHKFLYFKHGKKLTHAFPALLPSLPESELAIEQIGKWLNSSSK